MRFREIVESLGRSKLPKNARYGIPGARIWPELNNGNPYDMYRMLVAMAGCTDNDKPKNGHTGPNMVTLSYTPADEEIAIKAGNNMGYKSKELTPENSDEMPSVNIKSPTNFNSGKRKNASK